MVATLCKREICRGAAKRAGKPQKKGRRERFNATSYGRLWTIRGYNTSITILDILIQHRSDMIPIDHSKRMSRTVTSIPSGNKQWVWLALDANTHEIVGVYIGGRDEAAARKLWESLPPVYRQCAVAYTDFWAAYGTVLPSKRHRAVGKETGTHQLR